MLKQLKEELEKSAISIVKRGNGYSSFLFYHEIEMPEVLKNEMQYKIQENEKSQIEMLDTQKKY